MDPQSDEKPASTESTQDTSLNSETPDTTSAPVVESTTEPVISPEVSSSTADEIAPATPDSPSITPESAAAEAESITPLAGQTVTPSSAGSPTTEASQPVIGTAPTTESTPPTPPASTSGVTSSGPRRSKRKLVAILIVVLAVLLAGGYVYAFYLPNTPSHIYSSSLSNTGKALDQLVSYTKSQDTATYKSVSLDGTLKYKSASGSFDATLSGAFDKKSNGNLQFKADVEGQNITANLRSIMATGNTSPDVYVQVGGIKSYLDSAGLSTLDTLDGQWISIDHTLLDTYSASLKQDLSGTTGSSMADASGVPTAEQLNDAIDKVQTVNKQYIFTTDSSKAVLTNQKFIARETKNGRSADHYKVGYDKAHLQAYVAALGAALDSSKLNDWSKKANDGKSLSAAMNIKDLENTVQNGKGDYTFDVWADTKTKLVSSVQFADPSDKSSVFTIGQNYTGGTQYPFSLSFAGQDSTGTPEKGTLNLTVDTKSNKYTGDLSVDSQDNSGAISVSANFTLTPSNDTVKVSVPSGAKSVTDILNELGLGDLLNSTAGTQAATSQTNTSGLFTLTQ